MKDYNFLAARAYVEGKNWSQEQARADIRADLENDPDVRALVLGISIQGLLDDDERIRPEFSNKMPDWFQEFVKRMANLIQNDFDEFHVQVEDTWQRKEFREVIYQMGDAFVDLMFHAARQ